METSVSASNNPSMLLVSSTLPHATTRGSVFRDALAVGKPCRSVVAGPRVDLAETMAHSAEACVRARSYTPRLGVRLSAQLPTDLRAVVDR